MLIDNRMKYYFYLAILILSSCSTEQVEDRFLKKYPFFENVEIFNDTKTVSLNNFTSRKNKNGLEYLVDFKGNVIESRNYKNNLLNGMAIQYASNKRPMLVANFKNDTLFGNYYELDTLNGSLEFWSDKAIEEGIVYDNNYIRFDNGKVDLDNSSFYKLSKLNDSIILISLPCKYPFPYSKVTVEETNNKNYHFNGNESEIKSRDGVHYYYKIKNSKIKYITCKASYYRLSKGLDDIGITGRDIYFNKEINQ